MHQEQGGKEIGKRKGCFSKFKDLVFSLPIWYIMNWQSAQLCEEARSLTWCPGCPGPWCWHSEPESGKLTLPSTPACRMSNSACPPCREGKIFNTLLSTQHCGVLTVLSPFHRRALSPFSVHWTGNTWYLKQKFLDLELSYLPIKLYVSL